MCDLIIHQARSARNLHTAAWQDTVSLTETHKVTGGKQPKRCKVPPLISEYLSVQTVTTADVPQLNDKQCLRAAFHSVPQGAKCLRSSPSPQFGVEDSQGGSQEPLVSATNDEIDKHKGAADAEYVKYVFGIFRDEQEFVTEARKLIHPFDEYRAVPDCVRVLLHGVLTHGPLWVAKKRLHTLQRWKSLARDLEHKESELKEGMDAQVRCVLQGKRCLLLEHLAKEVDWPDRTLHSELRDGFRIVGMVNSTGVFASDVKPRVLSENELMQNLVFTRPALLGNLKATTCDEDHRMLWDQTIQETTNAGWLSGPFTLEELDARWPDGWLPVRRFGLKQGSKLRAIDDFTEAGVNLAFGCEEKVDLGALEMLVGMLMIARRAADSPEHFEISLASGQPLKGQLHSFWRPNPDALQPWIRTIDLKSAYKQFAVNPSDYCKSVVCLKDPDDHALKGFVMHTLGFGAAASVLHYNRLGRLLCGNRTRRSLGQLL